MRKILFVCVENSGRSQMAEAFAKAYGTGKIEATSAGLGSHFLWGQDSYLVQRVSKDDSDGFG